jgi:hypothetical protein
MLVAKVLCALLNFEGPSCRLNVVVCVLSMFIVGARRRTDQFSISNHPPRHAPWQPASSLCCTK